MSLRAALAVSVFLASWSASAQIQNEPVEVVTATTPSTFSERSGLWPSQPLTESTLTSESSTFNDRWNTVPGVQARESGSPTFSIRGSAQADRVLKLFDGTPLNMADGVGGSDLLIATEVLSDVSLFKGPASVFFGNSAMAGAVNHRLRFYEDPTVEGSIAENGGVAGDRRLALIVPLKSSKTQFSLMRERDPQNFLFQSTTSGARGRREGNLRDLLRATAVNDSVFANGLSVSSRAVVARSTGESSGSLYFPISSSFTSTASLVSAEARKSLGTDWLASVKLSNTHLWGLYDEGTATQSTSDTTRTSLFTDVNRTFANSWTLKTFSDVAWNFLAASYVGASRYYETDVDFGQSLQAALTPEITLQPSYRYQSRYGEWTKALAAVYSRGVSVTTLKVGEGFRAASLSDRFASYSTFVANPSLRPERSWTTELESAYEPGRRYSGFLDGFSSSGSIYYTNYSDLVDTRTTGPTFTKVNAGDARSFGTDLRLEFGRRVWMASGSYSYLNARNLTAREPLALSPEHQAALSVSRLIGPLLFEAKETLWSPFFDRDPLTGVLRQLPSWSTLDFTFRTIALTNWEFRGGVLNVLDEARELTIGYPEPQRRFFLSAERSF